MERDILEDLKIDRFALEKECSEHSELFYYWSEKVPKKEKIRDDLKVELKKLEGEIELKMRRGEIEIGVKVTEKAIAAAVDCYPEIVEKRKDLAFAEYELGEVESAEHSMRHRKGQINNLVQLFTKEYYSQPGNTTDIQEQTRDVLNKNLNKRRN